ncbi:unnamed protein product [Paramecium octaurelia]|uniref:Uncharacterized protein n=1 Tax=Paramecium octaurelia TaxID=43137 RepID=A0A8S1WPY8_PAROT|nr:unnamed protein product [Paramecium octaurelia]CAD8190847.1 unnamed protein product [Paramecium octaurelia]
MKVMIKRGRPKLQIKKRQHKYVNHFYMQNDHDCVKLFKLFTIQGSYKVRILTGKKNQGMPHAKQKNEVKKAEESNYPQYFFLATEKKIFSIENEQIVDYNYYMSIDPNQFQPKFELLIQKLNVVLIELDKNFIWLLLDILILYTELFDSNQDENVLVESIIQNLKYGEYSNDFQYLLNWQTLRNKTKEARYNVGLEEIKQVENLINKRKSRKVIEKLEKFIKKQYNQFKEVMDMEPINYLLLKLVKRFNKIMKVS